MKSPLRGLSKPDNTLSHMNTISHINKSNQGYTLGTIQTSKTNKKTLFNDSTIDVISKQDQSVFDSQDKMATIHTVGIKHEMKANKSRLSRNMHINTASGQHEQPTPYDQSMMSVAPRTAEIHNYNSLKHRSAISIQTDKANRYLAVNPLKWSPTSTLPEVFNRKASMCSDCDTPRTTKKKISLERSFNRSPWLHSKNNLHKFDDKTQLTRDKEQAKIIKKILRRKRKNQSRSKEVEFNA